MNIWKWYLTCYSDAGPEGEGPISAGNKLIREDKETWHVQVTVPVERFAYQTFSTIHMRIITQNNTTLTDPLNFKGKSVLRPN